MALSVVVSTTTPSRGRHCHRCLQWHRHPCEILQSFKWREILPVFQVVCSLIMTIYTVTIYEWFYLEKYTNQMPSFFKASLFCFIRGIEILLFVTILQVRIIPKNPKIEGMIWRGAPTLGQLKKFDEVVAQKILLKGKLSLFVDNNWVFIYSVANIMVMLFAIKEIVTNCTVLLPVSCQTGSAFD